MIPPVATPTTQPTQQAEHPYRRAQDATYQPPAAHNFGAPMQQPTKKPETVPKVFPPIYDPSVAANIYKRSMDAHITVTQRKLLSLAPEVRSQVREAITTCRTQPKDSATAQNLYQDTDDEQADNYINTLALTPANTPPRGSIIVEDPIDLYYKSLRPGEEPDFDALVIAKESSAVRSIVALVDNNQCVNCILDPGCQIIAMSENVCNELGLAYDPGRGITLYRTIRFKERIQCIGPSEFTGPRESVNVIPNWEECITGNYWAYYTHRVALGDAVDDAHTKLLHWKCRMSTMPVPIGGRKMWGIK